MDILISDQLKSWRERLGISQKRFAELAGISLTTLRQFEVGSHKPQKKTLKKLSEVMQGIETGTLGKEDIKPPRKKRKDAKPAISLGKHVIAVKAPAETASPAVPRRRGRPPKAKSALPSVAPATASAAKAPAPAVAKKPRAPWGSKTGRLTRAQIKQQVTATPAHVEHVAPAVAPIAAPVVQTPPPAPVAVPVKSAPAPVAADFQAMGAIQLSNLDLELINRILNMSGREKLALLERLM